MFKRRTSLLLWGLIWFAAIPLLRKLLPLLRSLVRHERRSMRCPSGFETSAEWHVKTLLCGRNGRTQATGTLGEDSPRYPRPPRDERTRNVRDQEDRVRTQLTPIQNALKAAKRYVSTALPFKTEERLRRLERIETDLAVTHPDPAQHDSIMALHRGRRGDGA